ncbi:unnamed protein product [Cunninghamella echinulata]
MTHLSKEEQAAFLERLLYEAKGKYDLLKMYIAKNDFKDWESQVVMANNKRHLSRNIRMEAEIADSVRRQTMAQLTNVLTPGEPICQFPEKLYECLFDQNLRLLDMASTLHKETAPPLRRSLQQSDFDIDIARAMVSVEEVDMLIALYNDCYSFSALPEFITPHLDENGDYDILLSSVMTLMLSHAVNLHAMKVDNHEHLSHAFYHYTRELLEARLTALQQKPDIMSLHTTFNLMLYEAENGYLDEAGLSRQSMATMIDYLHSQYNSMSVWQQSLLRHLLWAIHTADASRHNLQVQAYVICSSYMDVEKQRPSDHCAQPVDRLKEEYIYYRCRLADIIRQIDIICYKGGSLKDYEFDAAPSPSSFSSSSSPSSSSSNSFASATSPTTTTTTTTTTTAASPHSPLSTSSSTEHYSSFPSTSSASTLPSAGSVNTSISGKDIKMLEDQLWNLYHDLPGWVTDGQPLESLDLSKYEGYHGHPATRPSVDPCVHSRAHPVCKRTLDEVWIRRLRYHFLVEWHGTFLYLYQIFLPKPGEVIQLPFMRCVEHGKLMVDVLSKWADDPDFFDCYCYPALRSLMVASHIHRYLLQSSFDNVRNKGYDLLFNLFSVIQRSNIYNLYKETAFIQNIKTAFERIHLDYLIAQQNMTIAQPLVNVGAFHDPNTIFDIFNNNGNNEEDNFIYTATAS